MSMIDEDAFEHERLGVLRRVFGQGWQGRSDPGPNFFDLFIMTPPDTYDGPPHDQAIAALNSAFDRIDVLKRLGVDAVCAARQASLNWKVGPPIEAWSIVELRIDLESAVWLSLHEYETDEYSGWLVKFAEDGEPQTVRRIPALAFQGDPNEAGVEVPRAAL